MKLPRLDIGQALGPAVERMLYEGRAKRPQPLSTRERTAEIVAGFLVLVVVVAMAVAFQGDRDFEFWPAAMLTLAYALALRVRFSVGLGFTAPTQLILVPMLF